jgi:hypothetical protein
MQQGSKRYLVGVALLVGLLEGVLYIISDAIRIVYGFWAGFIIMFVLNGLLFFLAELGISHPAVH